MVIVTKAFAVCIRRRDNNWLYYRVSRGRALMVLVDLAGGLASGRAGGLRADGRAGGRTAHSRSLSRVCPPVHLSTHRRRSPSVFFVNSAVRPLNTPCVHLDERPSVRLTSVRSSGRLYVCPHPSTCSSVCLFVPSAHPLPPSVRPSVRPSLDYPTLSVPVH